MSKFSGYFYKIHVAFGRNGAADYYIHYRSAMELSLGNVPRHAVRDGYLYRGFIGNVDQVLHSTPEEYYEHMWE